MVVFDRRDLQTWAPHVDRVYLGWEFCPDFLPEQRRLRALASEAIAQGLAVTVATSFLPEGLFAQTAHTLETLAGWWSRRADAKLEIVVNDVGLLGRLARRDDVELVLGRLLNKQRRDPRIAAVQETLPPGLRAYLRGSSCNFSWFRTVLDRLGVRRAEFDSLPAGMDAPNCSLACSLHAPFSFVSAGRACAWAKTTSGSCGRRCVGDSALLRAKGVDVTVIAFGNALVCLRDNIVDAVVALAADRLVYTPRLP